MTDLLVIEDDPIMGESLVQRFELEGFKVRWVRRFGEALDALREPPDVVISDVRLPDGLATDRFPHLDPSLRGLPWFFLTGYGSVDDTVAAIRAGAREYLTKPFDIEDLVDRVQKAVNLSPVDPDSAATLGVSPAMREVDAVIRKVARHGVAVLLSGESGVGKEVAAQLLHSEDPRRPKGEFVAVNCAAVPETMLEAEFFGYEKGAFSGAVRTHKGYLERAHQGTLFLDEVAELPATMQAKLLRALQEKSFFRLGSEHPSRSNFRILAATNRDLYDEMNTGRFREDLFYRLAVIRIQLPPLRERPEDIRWLAERMLADMAREQERPLTMSDSFLRDLMTREWRGNVRELRSWLEQRVILSDDGRLDGVIAPSEAPSTDAAPIAPLSSVVELAEQAHIRKALQHCEGSVGRTAGLLRISRKTLWEKMKKHSISSP